MKVSAVNRKIILPQIIGTCVSVILTCSITCLLLFGLFDAFPPLSALPLLLLMADEAFVVSRTSLLIHHHARRTHAGLMEFLTGNGARPLEALMPYLTHMLSRTIQLSAWRWLLVMVMALLVFFFVVLFSKILLWHALLLLVAIVFAVVVASLLAVFVSIFLYERLSA
jgi:hypothetical protein